MTSLGAQLHQIASRMALFHVSNRRLAELAELKPGMAVLDLGCGTGLTAEAALEQVPEGLTLHLLDRDPALIEQARERLGDRITAYHIADASQVAEWIPAGLDRVLCNLALWYFPEPEAVLSRLRRLLKPTGRLCFTLLGTYFNSGGGVLSPHWAMLKAMHDRSLIARSLPAIERLPNQRSIEGTLMTAGFKPFHYEVQEIESEVSETEPGGELHSWLQLYPVVNGNSHAEAVERSLSLLPELSGEIMALAPRWRTVSFMAQPQVSPEEILMTRFGGSFPA